MAEHLNFDVGNLCGHYWTDKEKNDENAWVYSFFGKIRLVHRMGALKRNRFSCRCIKNEC